MGRILTDNSIPKDLLRRYRDRTTLLEHEVKELLKGIGLSVPNGIYVRRGEEIPSMITLKYPLVVKVSSSMIVSKTDVNGVRLGIKNEEEMRDAINELLEIRDAEGVLIEEMAHPGIEVIIGGIIDEEFGPIVMFGLGGIFVELYKDVAFALAPINREDALWLIKQVKGHKALEGFRGTPRVDIDSLLNVIITTSEVIATDIVKEIDLNPVALYPNGHMILDAKMKMNI